jgi:gluconate kinase
MTQHERMAKAFAALDDDDRRFWLAIVEKEAKRVQAARHPVLRLIPGGAQSTIKPNSTRTLVRIKNTGGR